jgi:hypothetical protein
MRRAVSIFLAICVGCGASGANEPNGGECASPAQPPAPACGAALCGNGTLDTCTFCGEATGAPVSGGGGVGDPADAGCQTGLVPYTSGEACDGTELGTSTCTSLGFGGGALACTASCTLDTNQCTTCLSDPHVAACAHSSARAEAPGSLSLATSADGIAVAWVAGPGLALRPPDTAPGAARFARFAPDLSLQTEVDCLGPAHARNVALAASPSGYVLAVDGDGGITIVPLDHSGSPRGASRTIPDAEQPVLAARQVGSTLSGGPLLAWTVTPGAHPNPSGVTVQAVLLADDGTDETTPVTVFQTSSLTNDYASAVFTGDGFLLADGDVARIALDGAVAATSSPAPGSEFSRIAWSGSDARLVYGNAAPPGGGTYFLRLDASGSPTASPVLLEPWSTAYNEPATATLGQDTVVVLPSGSDTVDRATRLEVTRVDANGATVTAPFGVVSDPELVGAYRLGVLDGEVVMAWVGGVGGFPGRIGLARLRP